MNDLTHLADDYPDDSVSESDNNVVVEVRQRNPMYLHMNSTVSISSDQPANALAQPYGTSDLRRQRWDLNYHEAAIYLQEGENNDKFTTHPRSQSTLPAYILTHNTWVYMMDLIASLMLLLLALVEYPQVGGLFKVHIAVHSSIELLCLLVIGLELGMRLKWLGLHNFTHHIRTMIKAITLVVMIMEAIIVLIRQANHFRVTRALRPLLLLDTHYFRGSRRFVRQIIQSLPPILDMLVLLIFVMLIFSILGFYLFSSVPDDKYFQNILQSFISLFVLLTTANYPDVMMPAYNHTRFSCLFFISYLVIELYFIMNLLLAVVYDTFLRAEKTKLQKLWLHERAACRFSFRLLVSAQDPDHIHLKHFQGLIKHFKPKAKRSDVYMMFKLLNKSQTGILSAEEFFNIYEVSQFKFKRKKEDEIWSSQFYYPFNKAFHDALATFVATASAALYWFATWKWFDYAMSLIIGINFLWILADTISISLNIADKSLDPVVNHFAVTWYTVMFAAIYVVEVLLKIFGLGPVGYFSSGWNVFDFVITLLAVLGVVLEVVDSTFYYVVVLRPFRLLRLFKVKRRYRDVLGTMYIIMSRMISLAIVMLMLFYFYAILGIELFSKYDMKNCCINSSVEAFYSFNRTAPDGYYYLNNFNNLLTSGVTLFELTVVNNWYIIMEGYAYVATDWSRIYFMLFYIITMVVLTVVVAFILEAFLFRIQYRNMTHGTDMDDDAVVKEEVTLTAAELRMCQHKDLPFNGRYIVQQSPISNGPVESMDIETDRLTCFLGERVRGRNEFGLLMYKDDVEEWLVEEQRQQAEDLDRLRPRNLRGLTV